MAKRIAKLAAIAKKFSDADQSSLSDIQKKFLGNYICRGRKSGFQRLPPRLGKAVSEFVNKLEGIQTLLSDAYAAGILSGYTKEPLASTKKS